MESGKICRCSGGNAICPWCYNDSRYYCNKFIEELYLPENALIAMIIREDEHIIPDGKTLIKRNDVLIMYREKLSQDNEYKG